MWLHITQFSAPGTRNKLYIEGLESFSHDVEGTKALEKLQLNVCEFLTYVPMHFLFPDSPRKRKEGSVEQAWLEVHVSKGQHVGKALSLHLFHTTVRQCMGVFLKCTTSSQPMLAVHGCSLILRPLPSPSWTGNEASMALLVALCYMVPLQQLKQWVGVDCRLMIVSVVKVHGMVWASSPVHSPPTCQLRTRLIWSSSIASAIVWNRCRDGALPTSWPLLSCIIPTLFAYFLACHPYIFLHFQLSLVSALFDVNFSYS